MTASLNPFGYSIPHAAMRCIADKIKVQMPYPPSKIGSIITPDMWKDVAQHSHQMGIVREAGPLAFTYKNGEGGLERHPIKAGDWVMFKWGAGTSFDARQGVQSGGWRYLSSFNDLVAWCGPEDMPPEDQMTWEPDVSGMPSQLPPRPGQAASVDSTPLPDNVRERTTYTPETQT